MSKASEWAERTTPRPQWYMEPYRISGGEVRDDGRLSMSGTLTPQDALAFARWILDTFGEEQA